MYWAFAAIITLAGLASWAAGLATDGDEFVQLPPDWVMVWGGVGMIVVGMVWLCLLMLNPDLSIRM